MLLSKLNMNVLKNTQETDLSLIVFHKTESYSLTLAQWNIMELEQDLLRVWLGLANEIIRDYIVSMRIWCQAVVDAEGG